MKIQIASMDEKHTGTNRSDAVHYIMMLCKMCQERGGYTLEDAVELHRTLSELSSKNTDATTQAASKNENKTKNGSDRAVDERTHSTSSNSFPSLVKPDALDTQSQILFLFELLEKSQKTGHLTLEEAWTVYNAQKIIFS
jgi:hypothetical protein